MGYIYVLENTGNSKLYVGQTTKRIRDRIYGHISDSKRHNYPIGNAIKKYGLNTFKIHSFCVPNNLLNEYEIEMIKRLNTLKPNGYNIEIGGLNSPCSEETKRKISIKSRGSGNGMYGVDRSGNKAPMFGKKHSKETKRKIGLKSIGRKTFLGKTHSDKTRYKFRYRGIKPIIQYDLNNNKIKEYFSMMEAVRQNGFEQAAIQRACCGKQKTSYGYIWRYKE